MTWSPAHWRRVNATTLSVPRGHGHNDYEQANPLSDSLDAGCTSIGVDVFLVSGELRIGHTLAETVPGRTLTSEYLDHPRLGELDQLMVDMKSDPSYTREQLFTAIVAAVETHPATSGGSLPVIVSGARPAWNTTVPHPAWVQFDGAMTVLDLMAPASAVPIISQSWPFGSGALTTDQQRVLGNLSARAFEHGKQLRFWATPDNAPTWHQLWRAGVDWVGADDLSGFATWRASLPQ
jgi:hypothetical protein